MVVAEMAVGGRPNIHIGIGDCAWPTNDFRNGTVDLRKVGMMLTSIVPMPTSAKKTPATAGAHMRPQIATNLVAEAGVEPARELPPNGF